MTNGEIIVMYRQSKDKRKQIKILSELTTYSQKDIINILNSYGENIKPYKSKTSKITEDQKKTIRNMYIVGASYKEIAKLIGVGEKTLASCVERMISQNEIKRRPHRSKPSGGN